MTSPPPSDIGRFEPDEASSSFPDLSWYDRLLHAGLNPTVLPYGLIRQVRLTSATNLLLMATMLPFAFYYQLSGYPALAGIMLCTFAAACLNHFAFRWHRNSPLAANLTVAILFAGLVTPGLVLHLPNELWIYLIPLLGLLLTGPIAGGIWTGLTLLIIATLPTALRIPAEVDSFVPAHFLHRLASVIGIAVLTACLLSVQQQTEKILADEIRQRRRAELEALRISREKNEFLASVSHEFRTPMHGILGLAELLEQDELSPSQEKRVDLIGSAAEALLSLVDDLVDLGKIEAGELSLQTLDFDPRDLVDRTLELVRPRVGNKALEISAHFREGLPPRLHGDPARLRQVLLNLLANAIRFTDKGLVEVSVGLESTTREGPIHVRFSVQDTGIGIGHLEPGQLFAPFFSYPSERSVPGVSMGSGGTGLGLAICKRLVEHMGGEISCRSLPTGGSEFWFVLPLRAVDTRADDERARSPSPDPSTRQLRILVVDDSALSRQVVEEQLRALGHSPTTVDSGEEALRVLASTDYDLLLVDCRMPGIDGFETVRRLRRSQEPRRPPLPVIVAMTGHTPPGADAAFWKRKGIEEHLIKPVRIPELRALLERHFHRAEEEPGNPEEWPALSSAELQQRVEKEYLVEGPRYLVQLRQALRRRDRKALADEAHSLAGISVYVQAPHLVESCEALEREAPTAADADLHDQVDLIADELELILARLRGPKPGGLKEPG